VTQQDEGVLTPHRRATSIGLRPCIGFSHRSTGAAQQGRAEWWTGVDLNVVRIVARGAQFMTSPRRVSDIGEEDASPTPVKEERRLRDRATLSVVLLSSGSVGELERAIGVLLPTVRRFGAEVVVARASAHATTSLMHEHPEVRIVHAPLGSTRTELCDAAMTIANGDILALREDVAVRDAEWLHSFRASLKVAAPANDPSGEWASIFGDAEVESKSKSPAARLLAPEIAPDIGRSSRPLRPSDRATGERVIAKEL
jgi:hypothetical protein